MERPNLEPIAPGRLGHEINRLRPVPPAVELTNLPAIRSEERRRQIRLTLRNDHMQKLP